MARQLTITIETRSLWIVQARHEGRGWCSDCSAEVELIGVPTPGVIAAFDASVHRSAGPDGSTLICLPSLLARFQHPPPGDAHPSRRLEKERT